MSTTSASIKFPAKHYIGFQARPTQDEVPLGFMTPDGTDKAAQKRKETVDNWAKDYGYSAQNTATDKLPAQSYDNKPMVGFKLGRNVRHGYGWGQGNVKWRIEDPRGFELEVTSPNLAQILAFCSIEEGEIQEQCIWARLGAENILVPVNSDVYMNTIKNTERMSKSASLRDLKIGDSAVMHNGERGIYYGSFFPIAQSMYGHTACDLQLRDKKRHVFLMQESDGQLGSRPVFKGIGSPKLSEVFEGDFTMTNDEAELEIARLVKEKGYGMEASSNDYGTVVAFTSKLLTFQDFSFDRNELNLADLEKYFLDQQAKNSKVASYHSWYYIQDWCRDYLKGTPFIEIDNILYHFEVGSYLKILQYLPGGKNHADYLVAQAQFQNGHLNKDWFENNYETFDLAQMDHDPEVDQTFKILTTLSRNGYWGNREETAQKKFRPSDMPQKFHSFSRNAVSSNGQKISCMF